MTPAARPRPCVPIQVQPPRVAGGGKEEALSTPSLREAARALTWAARDLLNLRDNMTMDRSTAIVYAPYFQKLRVATADAEAVGLHTSAALTTPAPAEGEVEEVAKVIARTRTNWYCDEKPMAVVGLSDPPAALDRDLARAVLAWQRGAR